MLTRVPLVGLARVFVRCRHVLGEQMREAVYINEGLFALKKCIRGLNKQDDYIPYQVRDVLKCTALKC
jgi:hypothetical protein